MQLSKLLVCSVNFTGLFITVKGGGSFGVHSVPVILLLRLRAAKMCLHL